jgi:hypothetical protein
MEKKRDEAWREYDAASKQVESQKDNLIDQLEKRLHQTSELKSLFTIKWQII